MQGVLSFDLIVEGERKREGYCTCLIVIDAQFMSLITFTR